MPRTSRGRADQGQLKGCGERNEAISDLNQPWQSRHASSHVIVTAAHSPRPRVANRALTSACPQPHTFDFHSLPQRSPIYPQISVALNYSCYGPSTVAEDVHHPSRARACRLRTAHRDHPSRLHGTNGLHFCMFILFYPS